MLGRRTPTHTLGCFSLPNFYTFNVPVGVNYFVVLRHFHLTCLVCAFISCFHTPVVDTLDVKVLINGVCEFIVFILSVFIIDAVVSISH